MVPVTGSPPSTGAPETTLALSKRQRQREANTRAVRMCRQRAKTMQRDTNEHVKQIHGQLMGLTTSAETTAEVMQTVLRQLGAMQRMQAESDSKIAALERMVAVREGGQPSSNTSARVSVPFMTNA